MKPKRPRITVPAEAVRTREQILDGAMIKNGQVWLPCWHCGGTGNYPSSMIPAGRCRLYCWAVSDGISFRDKRGTEWEYSFGRLPTPVDKYVKREQAHDRREYREKVRWELERPEREAAAARAEAEATARREAFMATHSELLARCMPYLTRSKFVLDVHAQAMQHCTLTEAQADALAKAIDKIATEDVKRAASTYLGAIGDRLRNIHVHVERRVKVGDEGYGRGGFGPFYITSLRTADGQALVVKSGEFWPAENSDLVISGTVKDHSVYQGERQTQLWRVKWDKWGTQAENHAPQTIDLMDALKKSLNGET